MDASLFFSAFVSNTCWRGGLTNQQAHGACLCLAAGVIRAQNFFEISSVLWLWLEEVSAETVWSALQCDLHDVSRSWLWLLPCLPQSVSVNDARCVCRCTCSLKLTLTETSHSPLTLCSVLLGTPLLWAGVTRPPVMGTVTLWAGMNTSALSGLLRIIFSLLYCAGPRGPALEQTAGGKVPPAVGLKAGQLANTCCSVQCQHHTVTADEYGSFPEVMELWANWCQWPDHWGNFCFTFLFNKVFLQHTVHIQICNNL